MRYIGIDIGDGESCVCVLQEESQIEPRAITITGRKSFVSAVAENDAGETVIGMDAMGFGASHRLSVRFKSKFLTNENGARDDMYRFAKGIYETLAREGILDGDVKVTVGCPAGWDDRTRKEYFDLLVRAGFTNPQLVSESRGAFMYAKYAHSIQLDPSLIGESALVIDIGSSTLDFAYVVDGAESGVGTFGDVFLGGGAIDEALLRAAVNESGNKAAVLETFESAPEWKSYCLLTARRIKEEFFTRQSKGETNLQCREQVTLMYDTPIPLRIQANETLIWRVVKLGIDALGGDSFYSMLDKALKQAQAKTKQRPPKLVLMTGGASRMRFFQELCRKRFSDSHLVLCDEPELSIAKGLAYSARVDDNIYAFNKAIDEYLKEDHIHKAVADKVDTLIDTLSGYLADLCFSEAKEAFKDWRAGKLSTIGDLNENIGARVSKLFQTDATAGAITSLVNDEMMSVCTVLQPQIDSICRHYNIECSQMQLDENVKANPDGTINIGPIDISALKTAIQVLITGLVATIMLLIPGGQIVDLIVIAVTAVAAFFGRNMIGNITERAVLPLPVRAFLSTDRVINDKFKANLKDTFAKELQKNNFGEVVLMSVESSLKQHVKKMALRTEIAITSGGKNDRF